MNLSPCYCINLRNASNTIAKIYDQYLSAYNLTIRQYSLLINIHRLGNANMTTLAAATNLDRTSLVRMLRPLIERNLVENTAPKGKRDRNLQLTEIGSILLTNAQSSWQNAQHEIEIKLGQDNIDRLQEILKLL